MVVLEFLTHLFEVLNVMFGGSKDDSLFLRLHHVPQEVQQQRWFVVDAQVKE